MEEVCCPGHIASANGAAGASKPVLSEDHGCDSLRHSMQSTIFMSARAYVALWPKTASRVFGHIIYSKLYVSHTTGVVIMTDILILANTL